MSSTSSTLSAAQSAARGTVTTIVLRIVSFGCTQWTLRRVVDPAVWGQTSIQLELVLSTVLFISREGFRLALTRGNEAADGVAWLSIPVVTAVASTALAWHLAIDDYHNPDYRMGGILYCLAALIEGLGEPAVLYALRHFKVAWKVAAESAATLVKTLSTVLLLQYGGKGLVGPVTAFGAAQVLYALTYTTLLYLWTGRQLAWPMTMTSLTSLWDGPTCTMVAVFTAQGFFKHLLTEGDRLLLTTLCSAEQQGVYAMASAYGGLAARLLLQPLEENARLLWSRLASSSQTQSSTATVLMDSYTVLTKAVLYIGLVLACIAVHYTGILLHILAGPHWANHPDAAPVLSAFCVYTALLAANGMTEAFVYAVATTGTDLARLSVVHTVAGLTLAVTATVLVPLYGTRGLVAANGGAMALRTMYSLYFAVKYHLRAQQLKSLKDGAAAKTTPPQTMASLLGRILADMSPPAAVWMAFAGSWAVTRSSFTYFNAATADLPAKSLAWYQAAGAHVGVGAASAIGTLSLAFWLETSFRRKAVALYKGKNKKLD